jgi:hypothetical protein
MNKKNTLIYQNENIVKFLIESPKYGSHEVIVDAEDYNKIKNYRWCIGYNVQFKRMQYICTVINYERILLHHFILNYKGMIDHINLNIFDNRKSNLRKCTHAQNMRNSGIHRNNKTGYKGITFSERLGKWIAYIKINYKRIHLGCFNSQIDAACAYNKAAKKYFGEFACFNVIDKEKL